LSYLSQRGPVRQYFLHVRYQIRAWQENLKNKKLCCLNLMGGATTGHVHVSTRVKGSISRLR